MPFLGQKPVKFGGIGHFHRKNISKRPPLWKMSTERALRCDTLSVNFFFFLPQNKYASSSLIGEIHLFFFKSQPRFLMTSPYSGSTFSSRSWENRKAFFWRAHRQLLDVGARGKHQGHEVPAAQTGVCDPAGRRRAP